ncbi:hypothetical protein KC573_01640 [candidate division WWE3 bacterium]|uniref:Rod shape-determining protein MreC n=1 Tax=candidate division WWE3 bacterium TaxID=2053526 RepID=A0A955LVX3_UNCKA|nr:hypothetical protein [candidate division WWE3 bacterium]
MKHVKIIIALIFLNTLLLLVDYTYPDSFVRRSINVVVQPVEQAVYLPGSRFINIATSFDDVLVENDQLRQQVRDYFSMKIENERLRAQNDVLRQQLELPERDENLVTVASVVGTRTIANNIGIVIDAGMAQDIQVGDIVVCE